MTAEEVIALADRKAREAGEKWELIYEGKVRTQTGCCPLEWLAGTGPHSYNTAVSVLELGKALNADEHKPLRQQIVGAADNDGIHVDVRALMLATFDFAEGGDTCPK